MVKYKIGRSDFIEKDEFFEKLDVALKRHNKIEKRRDFKLTLKQCKGLLESRGHCTLYIIEEMWDGCPFFMADEEVFNMSEIIDKTFVEINGDLESRKAFDIAMNLFKSGCRMAEGLM